jgi:hypothetical protein
VSGMLKLSYQCLRHFQSVEHKLNQCERSTGGGGRAIILLVAPPGMKSRIRERPYAPITIFAPIATAKALAASTAETSVGSGQIVSARRISLKATWFFCHITLNVWGTACARSPSPFTTGAALTPPLTGPIV